MATDVGMQRTLLAIAAALNEHGLDVFETARVQEIVSASIGGRQRLTVDDGGGLHDEAGTRVGAIRRAPSGEWIIDGQNREAARSGAPIPAADPETDREAGREPDDPGGGESQR